MATLSASAVFGDKIDDFDSDDRLQKIHKHPKKFQISIVLTLIEGVRIIVLAAMLFIAFSQYNLILGVAWSICRIVEGLILIYSEINYWGLLNIAGQYSGTSGAEKNVLSDAGRTILQKRNYRWTLATILFGIGTLAYSILFVAYEVVPPIIGWLGLVVGILLVFGNGIKLVKPNFKALSTIGALSGILFEVIIGGWLLFYS